MSLGLSGRLTRATIRSPLTPLFLLAAIVAGLIALFAIPREEEPQISVPMVDIFVAADGLAAADAVELVTKPLEAIVTSIDAVEQVYSQTRDDRVVVTARFLVGTSADDAILRVHEKIRANLDRLPIGIPEPLVVGRGINEVAIVTLTLSPRAEAGDRWTDQALLQVAEELRAELIKVPDVGLTYIQGGRAEQIRVEPDPERLALFGVTLEQLAGKLDGANRSFLAGRVREGGETLEVTAGQTLEGVPDIGLLLLTTRDGRPVYVQDVADVVIGSRPEEHRAWTLRRAADAGWHRAPAVTLAVAKRAGANAVDLAHAVLDRVERLKGRLIPPDLDVEVTRDYGETADEKANELLFHLGLATVSIVLLIALAVGWGEALVTAVVIPTTILSTLVAAWLMDYMINRVSHKIALDLRERLGALEPPEGGVLKVVEGPPGPPVLATLLAEIYGPDAATRRAVASELRAIFDEVPFIVDVDDSIGQPRPRLRIAIDQDRLEFFRVEEADVCDTLRLLLDGRVVGYSHRGLGRNPIEIAVALPTADLAWSERLAATPVPANALPGDRTVVELGDVVTVTAEAGSPLVFRRNGHFVDMVTAELAGRFEAPIYGMLEVGERIEAHDWGDLPPPEIRLAGQPLDDSRPVLLWDGEWEITWVTFRDMGAAFGVALLGIYVLVVAQFGSFRLPLVILTPVPLTLIGILFGHWLFAAPFSATSMIGFIALAGIIVRNSILLVDFIRHGATPGRPLREVLLEAGAVRFKPILLTALAAMIGAAVILLDPIFQGLAISLLFGLLSSTLLTVLVIPAIYVVLRDADRPAVTD